MAIGQEQATYEAKEDWMIEVIRGEVQKVWGNFSKFKIKNVQYEQNARANGQTSIDTRAQPSRLGPNWTHDWTIHFEFSELKFTTLWMIHKVDYQLIGIMIIFNSLISK